MVKPPKIYEICEDFFKTVLKKAGVSQESLATDLKISQPTIHNFFKGKDKNQARTNEVIACLIKSYEEKKATFKDPADLEKGKEFLKAVNEFAPFKKKNLEGTLSNPYSPLSGINRNYITRACEKEVEHWAKNPPVDLLIVGGPKTGKSSSLNRISEAFRDNRVIFVDFSSFNFKTEISNNKEFFRAFSNMVENGIGPDRGKKTVILSDISNFLEWLRDDVLLHVEKRVVLALDNIHKVPIEFMSELLDAFHGVINLRFRNSIFEKLSLVLTTVMTDLGAMPSLYESRFFSKCVSTYLENFSEPEVEELGKILCGEGSFVFSDKAYQLFGGQPFLTHVFLSKFPSNESGDRTKDMNISDEKFFHQTLKECGNLLRESMLARSFEKLTPEDRNLILEQTKKYQSAERRLMVDLVFQLGRKIDTHLFNTGLFRWFSDIDEGKGVIPISFWIYDEFNKYVQSDLCCTGAVK